MMNRRTFLCGLTLVTLPTELAEGADGGLSDGHRLGARAVARDTAPNPIAAEPLRLLRRKSKDRRAVGSEPREPGAPPCHSLSSRIVSRTSGSRRGGADQLAGEILVGVRPPAAVEELPAEP